MLIVVSKVKAMAKAVDLRTSGEFCESLSSKVQEIIIEAAKNARTEGIGTIKERHMPPISFEVEDDTSSEAPSVSFEGDGDNDE